MEKNTVIKVFSLRVFKYVIVLRQLAINPPQLSFPRSGAHLYTQVVGAATGPRTAHVTQRWSVAGIADF